MVDVPGSIVLRAAATLKPTGLVEASWLRQWLQGDVNVNNARCVVVGARRQIVAARTGVADVPSENSLLGLAVDKVKIARSTSL